MKKDINNPEVLKQLAKELSKGDYTIDQFELFDKEECDIRLTITRLTEIKTSFEYLMLAHDKHYMVGIFPFFKREEVDEVYWNKAAGSLYLMFNTAHIEPPIDGFLVCQSDDEFVSLGSVSGIALSNLEVKQTEDTVPAMLWGMLLPSYLKCHDLDGITKFIRDNRLMTVHADPHFYQLAPECLAESRVPMN